MDEWEDFKKLSSQVAVFCFQIHAQLTRIVNSINIHGLNLMIYGIANHDSVRRYVNGYAVMVPYVGVIHIKDNDACL